MLSKTTKKIGLGASVLGAILAFSGAAALAGSTTSTPGQHITLPGGLQSKTVGGITIHTNTPGLTGSFSYNTGSSSGSGTIASVSTTTIGQ